MWLSHLWQWAFTQSCHHQWTWPSSSACVIWWSNSMVRPHVIKAFPPSLGLVLVHHAEFNGLQKALFWAVHRMVSRWNGPNLAKNFSNVKGMDANSSRLKLTLQEHRKSCTRIQKIWVGVHHLKKGPLLATLTLQYRIMYVRENGWALASSRAYHHLLMELP